MTTENEARDYHGRWTASGVGYSENHSHPAGPYMDIKDKAQAEKADIVATHAADVARKLGYDPANINVVDDTHPFELNGKTLYAAGLATRPPEPKLVVDPDGSKHITNNMKGAQGPITLFTPTIGNDEGGIKGVVAHEITHQKFNALLSDARADDLKMKDDPDWKKETKWVTYDPNNPAHAALVAAGHMLTTPDEKGVRQIREFGFMRADGSLNDPYASKYPAYQALTKAMMPGTDELAKSDGVSDYSKEYWLGFHNRASNISSNTAIHETLAEIGRLKYSGDPVYHKKLGEVEDQKVYFSQGRKGVNPKWSALYKAMDENWKRRNSK